MSAGWKVHKVRIRGFWFWCFPDQLLILTVGGCGSERFEIQTRFCVQHLRSLDLDSRGLLKKGKNKKSNRVNGKKIKQIICLGSAGALDRRLKTGDLVCATRVIPHPFPEDLRQTPRRHDLSPTVPSWVYGECGSFSSIGYETSKEIIKILKPKEKNHSLHFGPLVSVNREVVSYEDKMRIFKDTGGAAVALEGFGGMKAAQCQDLFFTEIRVITDQASGDVHGSFRKTFRGVWKNWVN